MSERPTPETEKTENLKAVIKALRANAREDAATIERLTAEIKHAREQLRISNRHIDEYECKIIDLAGELNRVKAERDEAREVLREINAADWKTTGA